MWRNPKSLTGLSCLVKVAKWWSDSWSFLNCIWPRPGGSNSPVCTYSIQTGWIFSNKFWFSSLISSSDPALSCSNNLGKSNISRVLIEDDMLTVLKNSHLPKKSWLSFLWKQWGKLWYLWCLNYGSIKEAWGFIASIESIQLVVSAQWIWLFLLVALVALNFANLLILSIIVFLYHTQFVFCWQDSLINA